MLAVCSFSMSFCFLYTQIPSEFIVSDKTNENKIRVGTCMVAVMLADSVFPNTQWNLLCVLICV